MVFSFKEVQNGGDAVPCQSGDVWRPRQTKLYNNFMGCFDKFNNRTESNKTINNNYHDT